MLTRAQTSRKRSLAKADIAQQPQRTSKHTRLSLPQTTPDCTALSHTADKHKAVLSSVPSASAAASLLVSPSRRRHRRRTELADLKASAASLQRRPRNTTLNPTHHSGRLFSLTVLGTTTTHHNNNNNNNNNHTRPLCHLAVHWTDTAFSLKERLERRLGECVGWQQLWLDRNGWRRVEDGWSMAQCFERAEDAVVRLRIVEPSW